VRHGLAILALLLTASAGGAFQAEDAAPASRPAVPASLDAESARASRDRALGFLLRTQNEDGSWGSGVLEGTLEIGFSLETFHAWQMAANALACLALLEAGPAPERHQALARGLDSLCRRRMVRRGSDWDLDGIWSALYGLVALTRAARDPRFEGEAWRHRLAGRGRECVDFLVRNQVPGGGWGYYDDPPVTRRPTWGTSFCTALVLPSLIEARELGWLADDRVLARATRYVQACALPGGAFAYDRSPVHEVSGGEDIHRIKGSLGRTQVCLWGLARAGDRSITPDRVREGLEAFFEHHRFLDQARMKPVPHEGLYQNSGYFYFFGHYYAAQAIVLLPEAEREGLHARLRPHLTKVQRASGASCDYLASSSMVTASTSFLALTLTLGLPPDRQP